MWATQVIFFWLCGRPTFYFFGYTGDGGLFFGVSRRRRSFQASCRLLSFFLVEGATEVFFFFVIEGATEFFFFDPGCTRGFFVVGFERAMELFFWPNTSDRSRKI
jgi:hypothetical protein